MELQIERHFTQSKNLNIHINTSKAKVFGKVSDFDGDQYDSMIEHNDEDQLTAFTMAK
jgi:hypothetical protein